MNDHLTRRLASGMSLARISRANTAAPHVPQFNAPPRIMGRGVYGAQAPAHGTSRCVADSTKMGLVYTSDL